MSNQLKTGLFWGALIVLRMYGVQEVTPSAGPGTQRHGG